MSLMATFTGNFEQFNRALSDAEQRLLGFEVPVGNVDRALRNMTREFSGANVIRQAEEMAVAINHVGGVTTLTEREQAKVNATVTEAIAKYRAMGQEVPSQLQDLADATRRADDSSKGWNISAAAVASTIGNFAADALMGLVTGIRDNIAAVLEFGGHLTDLSGKTGLSTDALQEMKYAAGQSGVELETVTGAVTKMGVKLAGGNDSAERAVKALGLSFTDLRAMSPEEAFYTLTDAIRGVEDPMAQSKIATDLFGKSGTDLLPVINDAGGGFSAMAEKAQELGLVMSSDAVGAADSLGDAWDTIKTQGLVLLGEVLGPFIPIVVAVAEQMVEWARAAMPYVTDGLQFVIRAVLTAAAGINDFLATIVGAATKIPILGEHLGVAADAANYFKDNAQKARDMIAGMSQKSDEGAAAVPKLRRAVVDLSDDTDKAAASATKHAEALGKLAGTELLDGARQMASAIDQHGLKAVIAAQGVDKVHEVFTKAITVADASGQKVPQVWLDTAMATLQAEKGLNTYVDGVPKIGTAMAAVDPGKFFKDLAASFNKEIPKVVDGIPAFITEMGTKFDQGVANLGPSFGNALQAGFGGSARNFGQGLSTTILDAVKGGGNVGDAIGSFVGQGIGNSLNTWAQGALANVSGAMGGLLSGAANAVLPGVGALLGQGMSAIMDKIFKKEEQKVNDMRDKFIESAGGLHELNVKATEAGLSLDRLLDAKKTKDFDAAVKEIEAALAKFQERVADLGTDLESTLSTGTLLTKNLAAEMVALSKNDQAQQSIFQFLTGSIQQVTEGFNQSVGAWTANLSTVAAEVGKNADGLTQLKQLAFDNADEFERFGTIAVSAFEAARASGMSVPAALAAIKPGLDQLREAAASVGLSSEGAFGNMLRFAELSDQFKPMLDSVTGLDKVMTGLANTGLMTQETFDAITTSVTDVFNGMVAGGATAEEAMRLLQPQLQRIWEIENDMKFSTDGVNQELQEQAFNAGVVGNEFRSSGDKMTAAINALVQRLTDLTDVMMGKLPQSASTGASGVITAMGSAADGTAAEMNAIYDKTRWTFTSAMPALAAEGGGALIGQIGWGANGAVAQLDRIADGADEALKRSLPSSAQSGVNGINSAFRAIDVGGVQDAVHDIDWEFERGIPDATRTGVALVNTQMDVAEGAIGDVDRKATEVSDTVGREVPNSASAAARAIDDLRASGVTDLNAIEAAIRAILFGRSPGGFKDFLPMTRQAGAAIAELRRSSVPQLREIESLVSGISTRRLVSLPTGGSALLGTAGSGAGNQSSRNVTLVLTDERARVLAEVVAEQLPYLA